MKLPIKLQDLLQQSEATIGATSTLLGQKTAILNSTGVEFVTPEQLTLLFSGVPDNWDFAELGEVFYPL